MVMLMPRHVEFAGIRDLQPGRPAVSDVEADFRLAYRRSRVTSGARDVHRREYACSLAQNNGVRDVCASLTRGR